MNCHQKRVSFFDPCRGCWLACAGCLFCLTSVAAPVLDTMDSFFYTPAQRQTIRLARQSEVGAASPQTAAPSVSHLQGVVRRDLDLGTAWVNGQALPEGAPQSPRLSGAGAIVRGQRLQVGESVDSVTGQRTDVVAPGAVKAKGRP